MSRRSLKSPVGPGGLLQDVRAALLVFLVLSRAALAPAQSKIADSAGCEGGTQLVVRPCASAGQHHGLFAVQRDGGG